MFLHRKPSNSGVMFLWCVRDKLALISISLSFLIFFIVTTPYFLFLVPSSLRSTSLFWLIERDNLFCLDVILNFANNLLPTQMHFSFSFSYTFSIFADCDLIFTRCCLNDAIFKSCAVWMDLKPLTPIDLGIYKRSISLLRLKFDVMFNISRERMSISLTSWNVSSSIPKVGVNAGTAK